MQEPLFQFERDLHDLTRKDLSLTILVVSLFFPLQLAPSVGRPIQEEVTDPLFGMEEMALSGNERGGNRLPTFNQRRIQSEVRVPGGQEEREIQHSR